MHSQTMKVLILVSLLVAFTVRYSEASMKIAQPDPSRQNGGCFNQNTGHLSAGQTVNVQGSCEKAVCNDDGSTQYMGCGPKIVEGQNCTPGQVNPSAPYPDCCPVTCANSF